jgi:FkbM family methyltransferase
VNDLRQAGRRRSDSGLARPRGVEVRLKRALARSDVRERPLRTASRLAYRRLRYALECRYRPEALGRERLVAFDGDLRIWLSLDDIVAQVIYLHGFYELVSVEAYRRLLRVGSTVVDVGANIGQYTLLAAKHVGPGGVVLSFEPDPRNFRELERNIAVNGFRNVRHFQTAAANRSASSVALYRARPTETDPRRPSAHFALSSLEPAHGAQDSVVVPSVRIDDALSDERIEAVDVLKIDVEGTECDVVEGAAGTISASRPAILFEVNDQDTLDLLHDLEYVCHGIHVNERGALRAVEVRVAQNLDWLSEYRGVPPNLLALHRHDERRSWFASA